MVTHLEDEPTSEVDAADWLRPIRKPRGKGLLGNPSKAERGEKGDEEQRRKHLQLWQMAKGGGGGRGEAGKGEAREVKRSRNVIKEGCRTDALKGADYSDLLHSMISNAERLDKNATKVYRNGL